MRRCCRLRPERASGVLNSSSFLGGTVGVTGGGIAFGIAGFESVLALVGVLALLLAGLSLRTQGSVVRNTGIEVRTRWLPTGRRHPNCGRCSPPCPQQRRVALATVSVVVLTQFVLRPGLSDPPERNVLKRAAPQTVLDRRPNLGRLCPFRQTASQLPQSPTARQLRCDGPCRGLVGESGQRR